MFDKMDLEPGEGRLAFSIPEGFGWVYPTAYGCGRGENAVLLRDGGPALLYLAGEGRLVMGKKNIPLEGDAVLARGEEEAPLLLEGRADYLYVTMRGGAALLDRIGALPPGPAAEIGEKLAGQYLRARQGWPGEIYTASSQLFALLMEACRLGEKGGDEVSSLVGEAKSYIQREYAFLSGIEELAEELGVTASHLVRRFTAETGTSPGRYLQQVRLEAAKLLLLGREYSVEVIAGMTGFASSNYFCKVFRSRLGLSPGQYREKMRASVALDRESARRLKQLDDLAQL